jgi:hypothetical protein
VRSLVDQQTGLAGGQTALSAKTFFSLPKIKIQETIVAKRITTLKIVFI